MEDWESKRGRISISLGAGGRANGDRLIQLISRIQFNGAPVRAQWNHEWPRVARLTIRAGRRGNPEDLVEDPNMGIARLNGWPDYIRSQLRYLGTIASEEPNPDYRLFRIEVSPEVVGLIQQANGLIFIGRHRGTVRQGSRDVKKGANIRYVLQK